MSSTRHAPTAEEILLRKIVDVEVQAAKERDPAAQRTLWSEAARLRRRLSWARYIAQRDGGSR